MNVGQSRNTLGPEYIATKLHTHAHMQTVYTVYCTFYYAVFILTICLCLCTHRSLVRLSREPSGQSGEVRREATRSKRERCWGRAGMQPWLSCHYCCCGVKQHPSKSHKTVSYTAIIRSALTQYVFIFNTQMPFSQRAENFRIHHK